MNKTRQTVMAPEAPLDSNVIWIDTSSNEPIQKVFLNGEWKPIKESDDDAEFATGQKVSDINLVTGNPAPTTLTIPTTAETKTATPASGTTTVTIDARSAANYEITDTTVDEIEITIDTTASNTDLVTTIRFTCTATPFTITYDDDDLKWANDELPECETNAEYLIAIWNDVAVMTKLNTIEIS